MLEFRLDAYHDDYIWLAAFKTEDPASNSSSAHIGSQHTAEGAVIGMNETRDRFGVPSAGTALGIYGLQDGSLRAHDLEPTSLASAGVFSYFAKWPLQTAEIGRLVADIFLFGMKGRSTE